MLSFSTPPEHICILRLSAIGDICHTLPVIRNIQAHWPETKISWIIGKAEYNLLKGMTGIDFIIFDKKTGFKEYLHVYKQLKNLRFDLLLHMQMSLRASVISLLVNTKIKIGFDRHRAKDGQWLFTNHKIPYRPQQHVMDSLFAFTDYIGIQRTELTWGIPVSNEEHASANVLLAGRSRYVIISPCSSKDYRNWNVQGYAKVADYIKEKYHCDVVLTGGNSAIENQYAEQIGKYCNHPPLNLIGKTTLKELVSIIDGATFMLSPDSGPAHMATATGTPVIGLYATTNPDRARPYLSRDWVVNRYPDAIAKKFHKTVADVAWGTRVRDSWAMELISVADVTAMIDQFMQNHTQ